MTKKDQIECVVYLQYSDSVDFVVTHKVIFKNVFSSLNNAQAYSVSPYCIMLLMHEEFLQKNKKTRNDLLFHSGMILHHGKYHLLEISCYFVLMII